MDRIEGQNPLWNLPLKPSDEDKKLRKKGEVPKSKGFSQVLRTEEERKAWEAAGLGDLSPDDIDETLLGRLLDEVKIAGKELVDNPTPQAMKSYKGRISKLLQAVIRGSLELKETLGRLKPSTGTRPKYTQIQIVNEKLDKLGAFILQDQKDKLEILKRVEELNGLLVNLMT